MLSRFFYELKELIEVALNFIDDSKDKSNKTSKKKFLISESNRKFEIIEVSTDREKKFIIEPKFEIEPAEDTLKLRRKKI